MWTEGMEIRATGRVLEKSYTTIICWEQRVADKESNWSPPAPLGTDVTLEADELYTRVDGNFPPEKSQGWKISFMERHSRYWLLVNAGLKNTQLFKQGTQAAWQWAKGCVFIRWFTDGEKRYAQQLWLLVSQLPES